MSGVEGDAGLRSEDRVVARNDALTRCALKLESEFCDVLELALELPRNDVEHALSTSRCAADEKYVGDHITEVIK